MFHASFPLPQQRELWSEAKQLPCSRRMTTAYDPMSYILRTVVETKS